MFCSDDIPNPKPPEGEPQDYHHEEFSSRRLNRRICLTTSLADMQFCRGGRCLEKFLKIAFFFKQYGSIKHEQTVYMFLYCQVEQQCIGKKIGINIAPSQKELPLKKGALFHPSQKMPIIPKEKKNKQLKQQWKAWLSFKKKTDVYSCQHMMVFQTIATL